MGYGYVPPQAPQPYGYVPRPNWLMRNKGLAALIAAGLLLAVLATGWAVAVAAGRSSGPPTFLASMATGSCAGDGIGKPTAPLPRLH